MTSPDTSAVAGGDSLTPRVTGTVRVVGAGLLGASVGHALRALGVDVVLEDASPSQLRLAIDYGAGRAATPADEPTLIVVAVPPDVVADVVERELRTFPRAVVTDVENSPRRRHFRAILNLSDSPKPSRLRRDLLFTNNTKHPTSGCFVVPGQGFEPRLPGPKPGVLPLDDPGVLRRNNRR